MQPPKQIPLTDNEDEDIGVKLFSESDFGRHLLITLNEKNSIADANADYVKGNPYIYLSVKGDDMVFQITAASSRILTLITSLPTPQVRN